MMDQDAGIVATAEASLREKRKLIVSLGRRDSLLITISALVMLDTLGAVSSYGAQSFTWLVFLALVFLIPYALLVAELGSAFPQEGGPYVWVRLAFGRLASGVTILMWWVSNPVWLGGVGTIIAITVFGTFFTTLHGFWYYVFALAFIWSTVGTAIVSLKVGKWIPGIGAWGRSAILAFFTLSVIVFAAKHGIHGFGGKAFLPSYAVFIVAVPILVFNYFGFEVPSSAGEEMENPRRDVPVTVTRAALSTVLLYGIPILSILVVLPASQVTSLGGFIDALKTVFTVYGGTISASGTPTLSGIGKLLGDVCALGFIGTLLTNGAAWIMAADRSLAMASLDGAGPRLLGRISARQGTPISANILSGITATVMMVLATNLTSGNASRYFGAVLGLAISTGLMAYLLIFPSVIRLRYKYPGVARPYRVPFGNLGVWIVGLLTTAWVGLAVADILWPGLGTANANLSLPGGFTHQRLQYELLQIVPLLLVIGIGAVLYRLGRSTRQEVLASTTRIPSPSPAGSGGTG